MYGSWGRPLENLPEELTDVWTCSKEGCNGWIRASLSFETVPVCAQCQSSMISSKKKLPILMSSLEDIKRYKKSQRIKANTL